MKAPGSQAPSSDVKVSGIEENRQSKVSLTPNKLSRIIIGESNFIFWQAGLGLVVEVGAVGFAVAGLASGLVAGVLFPRSDDLSALQFFGDADFDARDGFVERCQGLFDGLFGDGDDADGALERERQREEWGRILFGLGFPGAERLLVGAAGLGEKDVRGGS